MVDLYSLEAAIERQRRRWEAHTLLIQDLVNTLDKLAPDAAREILATARRRAAAQKGQDGDTPQEIALDILMMTNVR